MNHNFEFEIHKKCCADFENPKNRSFAKMRHVRRKSTIGKNFRVKSTTVEYSQTSHALAVVSKYVLVSTTNIIGKNYVLVLLEFNRNNHRSPSTDNGCSNFGTRAYRVIIYNILRFDSLFANFVRTATLPLLHEKRH